MKNGGGRQKKDEGSVVHTNSSMVVSVEKVREQSNINHKG
jgi:hypothetical protein